MSDTKREIYIRLLRDLYEAFFSEDAIRDMLELLKEEPEQKKGKWTTEEVAEILFNAFGDDCACNFNGIEEWLPERCKYTYIEGQCPNPKEKHGCWIQFIIQGGADMRGTGDNSDE